MKKIIAPLFYLFLTNSAFAANDTSTIYGVSGKKLKDGNVTLEDIPLMISNVTNYLLGISATIAVMVIIYGAFQISLGSVSQDKDKGKQLITGAIIGFILAMSAWAIISLLFSNLD